MSDIWLVVAVDWEEHYVRAVVSSEEEAIARARVQAARERDYTIIIERHRLDPAIDETIEPEYVEYLEPRLQPAFRATFIASAAYEP